jgi:hypothetical protein
MSLDAAMFVYLLSIGDLLYKRIFSGINLSNRWSYNITKK